MCGYIIFCNSDLALEFFSYFTMFCIKYIHKLKSLKKIANTDHGQFLCIKKNIAPVKYYSYSWCNQIKLYWLMPSSCKPLIYFNLRKNSKCYPQENCNLPQNESNSQPSCYDLILFNSIKNHREKRKFYKEKSSSGRATGKPLPVSLKYLNIDENTEHVVSETVNTHQPAEFVNFPYSQKISYADKMVDLDSPPSLEGSSNENEEKEDSHPPLKFSYSNFRQTWMNDYEKYTEETDDDESDFNAWRLNYGSPNPDIPVSTTPCGGCGAFLHCQDAAIPGYLPSEIFEQCDSKDLLSITCQRCHFMKYYNTILSISVDQDLYPQLLRKIKNEKALVILLVDLTDFPCSIWPGILDIIGKKRPLFIVGNKVDLLWSDCKSWLLNVTKLLRSSFPSDADVKHVALISAKTGFGVEELINKLHNIWQYKGDVYLLGCTNVGKSTLFNALLQSDYCKVKAVDLLQRATTSPWPGTTLNLLKFPILRPEGWRLHLRTLRLISERKKRAYEEKIKQELLLYTKTKETTPPQLIGHIGRTFSKTHKNNDLVDDFTIPNQKQIKATDVDGSGLDPKDPAFVKSKWFYDTPGVLHEDQILDILTTEELMLTVPKKIIEPRTFLMKPKWSLFIAGLARLDYIEGTESIRFTVCSSTALPITICHTNDAEQIYKELLGTEYMLVPQGTEERLRQWPKLNKSNVISLMGSNSLISCADIILSSAGWISVTPPAKEIYKFIGWTPGGRGIHVRSPSLLPNAVNLRGKKLRNSPAYARTRPYL